MKWISAKDQLPYKNEDYSEKSFLIAWTDERGRNIVEVAKYYFVVCGDESQTGFYRYDKKVDDYLYIKVQYWMWLPKFPTDYNNIDNNKYIETKVKNLEKQLELLTTFVRKKLGEE